MLCVIFGTYLDFKNHFLNLKFTCKQDSCILSDEINLYAKSSLNDKLEPKEGLGDTLEVLSLAEFILSLET